jgi:hypothetical protein
MARSRLHPLVQLLRLCPTLIAILWVAGVAHFRGYELNRIEWLVIAGSAFVLQLLTNRAAPVQLKTPLPPGTTPRAVAALAASMLALLAAVLGGVFEVVIEPMRTSETSWALRTAWHAACVFAASYCAVLLRLQQQRPPASPPAPPPS